MIPIMLQHQLAWRIRATFAGRLPPKEYVTPDVRCENPGWADEIFNRVLERLEFFLPTGHSIFMEGMEQYNFFVEATQSSRGRGSAEIKAFWLCGKVPGKDIVELWRVGDGKVIRDCRPFGREWGGGPTRGWKKGNKGGKARSMLQKT